MPSLNRVIMNRRGRKMMEDIGAKDMDIAEISGQWGQNLNSKSYVQYKFPDVDICAGPVTYANGDVLTYDLIIANQVWEHLDRPYAATKHVIEMLRPGGYFWLATPFHIPYHGAPHDCSRWSARGLKNLLVEAGFEEDNVKSASWGNREAAMRNLEKDWPPMFVKETDSLENDRSFPIISWALAQKTA